MRRVLFTALAAVLVSMAGMTKAGEFDAGVAAFERGDHAAALASWRELAEQGHADAQFNVAIMYMEGLGVDPDPAGATGWFERAAEQGDPIAAYNLGIMHAEGKGVAKDHARAALWYRRAAGHDHPEAMQRLSNLYTNGLGVDQDVSEGLRLMERARETECLLGETQDNHRARVAEFAVGGLH